jgi:hypothetical protein
MGFLGVLREFLESSTIHGLVYISTAKLRVRECIYSQLTVFRPKLEN